MVTESLPKLFYRRTIAPAPDRSHTNTSFCCKSEGRKLSRKRSPYSKKSDFEQLGLREVLNKIAHANPSQAGFFANDVFHDLILSGKDNKGKTWIAIVSIVDLCRAVKSLPDQNIQNQTI